MFTTVFDLLVTQDHLTRGEPRVARHCPLALSLAERFGGEWLVVPHGAFQLQHGSWEPVIRFPPALMDWVDKLDRGQRLGPRTWRLERTRVAYERVREPVDWTAEEVA